MTPLAQYLAKNRVTVSDFARRAGCDISQISRIKDGKQSPRLELAERIIKAANRKLTFRDLMSRRN